MTVDILQRNRDMQVRVFKRLLREIQDNTSLLDNKEQISMRKFLQADLERTEQGSFDHMLVDNFVLNDGYVLGKWYNINRVSYGRFDKEHFICTWLNRRVASNPENSLKGAINGLYL